MVLPFHLCVSALIDNGSAAVLIDKHLASKLGLCQQKLPKPMPFNVALLGELNDTFLSSNYMKLACISNDSRFTSHSICTIVVPNLCTPLLLGGPFLRHNKIVIDQGYNLLNPQVDLKKTVVPPPPKMRKYCLDVMRELKHVLLKYKVLVNDSCKLLKGVNVVATI